MAVRIGIIGGSGVYAMKDVKIIREIELNTPFGKPSDNFILADVNGVQVVFLPRHGRGHRVNPTEVNYRANIFGMKMLGVKWVIAVSAVGSLQEEIVPGHVVLVDQFIDRTSKRKHTFYEDGIVGHVPFSAPVCNVLHSYLKDCCEELKVTYHNKGVYVNMEGPAFSTVAESNLYRSWQANVVGMTALTEAKLAREAEISYAVVAMATDYDCWRPGHDAVTVDAVIAVLKRNSSVSQNIVLQCVAKLAAHTGPAPAAWSSLQSAIMTAPEVIPPERLKQLAPLIGAYYPTPADLPASSIPSGLVVFAAVTAALCLWARLDTH